MTREEIERAVREALDEIAARALGEHIRPWEQRRAAPKPSARARLSIRLLIVTAIKEWELAFIKETLADREAIEAAKAYAKEKP